MNYPKPSCIKRLQVALQGQRLFAVSYKSVRIIKQVIFGDLAGDLMSVKHIPSVSLISPSFSSLPLQGKALGPGLEWGAFGPGSEQYEPYCTTSVYSKISIRFIVTEWFPLPAQFGRRTRSAKLRLFRYLRYVC